MVGKRRGPNKRVQERRDEDAPGSSGNRRFLPLRWLVIIVVAAAVGLAVGRLAGLTSGISVGMALAGLLHKILD